MPKVSVLIPSRNERFLPPTVADVLAKARGDLEVIVCLDGYWPDPPLPDHPRLRLLHRGTAQGMRQGINAMVAMSTGDYLMKLDGHCMVAEGFDLELAQSCDQDWLMVPRRHALDAEQWCIDESQPKKYPIDAHYLSYPYERPGDRECGMHGTPWGERKRRQAHVEIDDEMSSQGSCWFMARSFWDRTIRQMDTMLYGPFISEMQEIGLKAWLSGGALKINKRTWYAHLRKGKKYGRGYTLGPNQCSQSEAVTTYWMTDQWTERTRDLRWLVEHFSPVPGWPADLDQAFHEAKRRAHVAA